jgi:hypothetical protein
VFYGPATRRAWWWGVVPAVLILAACQPELGSEDADVPGPSRLPLVPMP